MHPSPNPKCPVGRNIALVLESRIMAAQQALQDELSQATIAEFAGDVARREHRRTTSTRAG
jgi:hypothetical protein